MTRTLRRLGAVALAVGASIVLLVAAAWYLPSASLAQGHSVPWALGSRVDDLDPSLATTTTVIMIEASHPTCAPGDSWYETFVTYTPISVTIQIRMKDADAAKCPWPDPRTGLYPAGSSSWFTSGLFIHVQLREPLGGRPLFDGSKFPAVPRPYR